jgi:hypothetical protein
LDQFISQRGLYVLIGVIIVLLVGLYLFAQVGALFQAPKLELVAPLAASGNASTAAYDFKTNTDRVTIKGGTDSQTLVTINGALVATNAVNEFTSSEIPLPAAENKIRITATNQFGRSTEILLTVSRLSFTEDIKQISTVISIVQATELKIKSDNQKQVTLQARSGEAYNFISQNAFELSIAEANKVAVTVNGLAVELRNGSNSWRLDKGALLQN